MFKNWQRTVWTCQVHIICLLVYTFAKSTTYVCLFVLLLSRYYFFMTVFRDFFIEGVSELFSAYIVLSSSLWMWCDPLTAGTLPFRLLWRNLLLSEITQFIILISQVKQCFDEDFGFWNWFFYFSSVTVGMANGYPDRIITKLEKT